MKTYKIYVKGNYLVIFDVTKREYFYGIRKDVHVDKSNVNNPSYRFFKVKGLKDGTIIELSQILKEDSSPYSEAEFDTFYQENTGNFNGGGIAPTDGGIAIIRTDITSADLASQDISGFISYINSVATFAVGADEERHFFLTDTQRLYKLIPNGRSFGIGQPAITSADVIYQDRLILNTPLESAKTIVFRGDSLMTGYNITATDRWPKVLCDALGYTESNLAVAGTSAKTTPLSVTPTKTSSMKYIVFGYGTNDRGLGGNTPALFEVDMTNLVNDAISKGWSASEIILVSMPGYQYQSGGTVSSILSYNTAISNVATATGCAYIDMWYSMVTGTPYGPITNTTLLAIDSLHPSKLGCKAMAKIVMASINYKFHPDGQKLAVKGISELTDVKISKFIHSTSGTILGVADDGTVVRLLGLPDNIIAQGMLWLNKGFKQVDSVVPASVTDMDFVLKGASKIFSANDGSNYAEIQPYDNVTGNMNFRNRYNLGHINFYVHSSQLLALDIQPSGILKSNYGITMPYGTSYLDQSVSASLYGRLNLYDSSGDSHLRNSFATGKFKTYMSGGTSGNQVQVKQMFASGREQLQDGGTFTDIPSARLAVNSTTEGFLPPRMTTTQKNAIASPAEGLSVYDSTLKKMCFYNGTAWETITSS